MNLIVRMAMVLAAFGVVGGAAATGTPDPDPAAAATPGTVREAGPTDPSAWFELPGDYSQHTSVAQLRERFGAANVVVDEHGDADNGGGRRVVLFPDDPTRRAYVEFHDREALEGIAAIIVRDAGSRWRGKGGVHVGMSFAGLREANARPFAYSGFDAEGRAWIRDSWSPDDPAHPALGALDVGEDDHMYFGVELRLRGGPDALPAGAWPLDESAVSDDPRWPRLGASAEVAAFSASTSLDDEWE